MQDAVLWPLGRLLVSKDELEMLEKDVFGNSPLGCVPIHKNSAHCFLP